MKKSTKIKFKAAAMLLALIVASPVVFIVAGIHEKWFAKREMIPSQGTFWYGIQIMAVTYIEVFPELWDEFKYGVESGTLER